METWTARKRSWDEENPIEYSHKRRDPNIAAGESHPPLPQYAGRPSTEDRTLNQRRLPPPCTPSSGPSAEGLLLASLQLSPPPHTAGGLHTALRPRSQSLFDVFHQPSWQRHGRDTERIADLPSALDLGRSLPPIGSDTHRPHFGTEPAADASGGVICCPRSCEGQACLSSRVLMRKLASELALLHTNVNSITRKEYPLSSGLDIGRIDTEESLEWALDLVQWTNTTLRDCIENANSRSPHRSPFQPDRSPNMRRGQHHIDQHQELPSSSRQYSAHHNPHAFPVFTQPGATAEDSRRTFYGSDIPSIANSPHHTVSSSGSIFMPPQSPMQAPQPSRSTMLPSPSSMNFPNVPNLPPISPPSISLQPSAQAAHLQDLQHQVSVKTLAFQTLQREYDGLLQKLERQRMKCAALEKKFEVSDVELNGLIDEKEKFQSQVAALESQAEELQQNRDEARRQLVANGAQYMRIMEMANRLQAQGADDKRRWESERSGLEQRIRTLEEAMVAGTDQPDHDMEESATFNPGPNAFPNPSGLTLSTMTTSTETVNVLRAEIGRLRARTQILETALQTMKEESISIQQAARKLAESGGKIEKAVQKTVDS